MSVAAKMTKAVFVTKPSSIYDDRIEHRYHFPRTYLNQVKACVGDQVLFYEPRRPSADLSSHGGRQAYFATAFIKDLVADPQRADHYYAIVDTPTFVEFTNPVSFVDDKHYYEKRLRKDDGSTNRGLFGRAVRLLDDEDFNAICAAGFADADINFTTNQPSDRVTEYEFAEPLAAFEHPIVEQTIRRRLRERAFAVNVRAAYKDTCAMTGIRLVNGGGRAEMEAAHIRPVESDGPHLVQNGIALSRTVHWMFDRGFLSLTDDLKIMVAESHIDPVILRLLPEDRRLRHVPDDPARRPHPVYLQFHRQRFKG